MEDKANEKMGAAADKVDPKVMMIINIIMIVYVVGYNGSYFARVGFSFGDLWLIIINLALLFQLVFACWNIAFHVAGPEKVKGWLENIKATVMTGAFLSVCASGAIVVSLILFGANIFDAILYGVPGVLHAFSFVVFAIQKKAALA